MLIKRKKGYEMKKVQLFITEVVLFERGNFIVELETFQNPMAW